LHHDDGATQKGEAGMTDTSIDVPLSGVAPTVPTVATTSASRATRAWVTPQVIPVAPVRQGWFGPRRQPTVAQWADARRLHFSEGQSVRQVARTLGLSRRAVRRILHPFAR
jgi:Homeodomain-like domain